MGNTYPMAMVSAPGSIEFVDFLVPDPSPTQVLIKTKAVSICGSDIHTYRGTHPFAPLPARLRSTGGCEDPVEVHITLKQVDRFGQGMLIRRGAEDRATGLDGPGHSMPFRGVRRRLEKYGSLSPIIDLSALN